ncbi:MAG: ABC transporter permease [Bacteroidales bacterium]|nr:ABC transporter permease [Bacteroidales bacterium]
MIRNYIITALRNLFRQKGFSIINISGLAIGMAISILIFLWVKHELSYNKFNENADLLYRLVQTQYYSSGPLTTTCMPGPIAKDIREDIPEIVNSFMYYVLTATISYEDKLFTEEVRLADPELFDMFSFEFVEGDPEHVFENINSVVLTEKMAEKIFDDEDAIGKVIKYNDEHSFKVTGIIKETPENSSFRFDICIPFEYIENFGFTVDKYGWNSYYVYVELSEGSDYKQLNEKIKDFIIRKKDDKEDESEVDLFLFPLTKIHLHSYSDSRGDIQYIYIFSAIAIFILVIACINFMNLSTARSAKRSREISIRKTVGANRNNLINQFLGESMIISFMAMILAIFLVVILLPYFNELLEKNLKFDFTDLKLWSVLIVITFIVGLFAGSYPAFYLSAFNPIKTLRNGISKGKGNFYFRRILVVFQFTLSVGLIISTIVVNRQLSYLQNNKLGMNLNNVLYFSMRGESKEKYDVIKNELLKNPNIKSITRANSIPFYIGSNSGGFDWEGRDTEDDILIGFGFTDADYIKTLGMKLADGRYYSQSIQSDTASIVINEKAAKAFNIENPVGKWIKWGDDYKFKIIGVVKDFHHLPMQYDIDPLVLIYSPERCRLMFVKTSGGNQVEINDQIQATWESVFPNFPFEPQNLKDIYEKTYTDESRLIRIIGYFSILAILISCLGLFALAAYMTEQRTKEIGIRKVLGASVSGVISLVSKEFLKWVVIANIIAFPLAWLAMDNWLNGYVYHTKLSPEIFIYAFILSVAIALITVSYQSIKSAIRNPVNSIKYE